MTAVTAAEERLYGLPLDEFTDARNRLAREAGKQGDREAADAIRSLKKPSVAAWALNRLARARGAEVSELVAAGERLRSAQEDLLAGGDRSAFAEASKAEQELVARLTREAVEIARESGAGGGGEALGHRIADTLRAAALDPAVAESLVAGRLVREQTASGLGGGFPAPGGAPARARKRPKDSAAHERELRGAEALLGEAEKAARSARKSRDSAARTTARLRAKAEEALERVRAAEVDERAAEDALATAGEERDRLARRAQELRRALEGT